VAEALIRETFSHLVANPTPVPERFKAGDHVLDVAAYLASLNDFSVRTVARSLGVETPGVRRETRRSG
jgi:hypothetical protein